METQPTSSLPTRKRTSNRWGVYVFLLVLWFGLVGGGLYGGSLYLQHVKKNWTSAVNTQTDQRLDKQQASYEQQLAALKTDMNSQLDKLQQQVQTFNELLNFAKDNSSQKTDNTNQLYTQLNDLKSQLDELKKNLDVLK